MNEQLLSVIIAGYFVCLLIGWLVGNLAGHAYEKDGNRSGHWTDPLTGGIWIIGVLATITLVTNLVIGFIEGVR